MDHFGVGPNPGTLELLFKYFLHLQWQATTENSGIGIMFFWCDHNLRGHVYYLAVTWTSSKMSNYSGLEVFLGLGPTPVRTHNDRGTNASAGPLLPPPPAIRMRFFKRFAWRSSHETNSSAGERRNLIQ